MKKCTFWLIAFCCLFQGYMSLAAVAQQVQMISRVATTIPCQLSRKGGVPLVTVNLDGQFLGIFVFDTGANLCFLEAPIATKLGLVRKPALANNGARISFDGKPADIVTVPNCRLGSLTVNIMCLVLDGNPLTELFGQHVDGIIGATFFAQFATLFNFQKQEIMLWYPGQLAAEDLKPLGITQDMAVPTTTIQDDNFFLVSVRFNETAEENLIVDTGSAWTLVSPQLARQLKLRANKRGTEFQNGFAKMKVNRAPIPRLSIGRLTVPKAEVGYSEEVTDQYRPRLGLDILTRYLILIDLPQKKMFFKPLSEDKPAKVKKDR